MKKIDESRRQQIKDIVIKKMPEANIIAAKVIFFFAIVILLIWILYQFDFFAAESYIANISLIGSAAVMFLAGIYTQIRRGEGNETKYIIAIALILSFFFIDTMSGYKTRLIAAIPVVLSLRYYDKKFTRFVAILEVLLLFISAFVNAYLYKLIKVFDLNYVYFTNTINVTINGFMYDEMVNASPDSWKLFLINIRLSVIPSIFLLILIYMCVILMMNKNLLLLLETQDLTAKEQEQKAQMNEMKTKMMLSQIQPHFTYNTLASIAALCDVDPQKAKGLTIDFTNYLRNNLKTLKSDAPIFFQQEMEHVEIYLRIEKERFGDLLNYDLDICASEFFIASLTIQPLVENAVKHGVCTRGIGGTVTISSYEVENGYEIIVSDDGVGFDMNAIDWDDGTHIGINSVRHRLSRICNGTLTIESKIGEGTKATIFLPKEGCNQ